MFFTWCGIGPLKVRIPRISEVFMALTFSRGAEVFLVWCYWLEKKVYPGRKNHAFSACSDLSSDTGGRDLRKPTSGLCASFSSSGKRAVGLKSAATWPTEIVG